MPIKTGLEVVLSPHLRFDARIVLVGEGAASIGEILNRAGGPPLSVEADRFALLTDDLDPPKVGRLRDLPDDYADVIVLRRAWASVSEIDDSLEVALRAIRPGGEVIAADLAVDALLGGSVHRYPVRLMWDAVPEVKGRLLASTPSAAILGLAAVRVGLRDVWTWSGDDEIGVYDDSAGYLRALESGRWRGGAWASPDRVGAALTAVGATLSEPGLHSPIVDREPWMAVVGTAE